MAALVRTSWYRPPELRAATMDDCELGQDREETTPCGSSLDVWSFGAVVYQAPSGEILVRRARNGAEMAQAVADVIGACPAEGPGALEYMLDSPAWQSWAAAAATPAVPSTPLPESGAEWDLVRACLRWDPAARVTMQSAMESAWFGGRVAAPESPEAALTSQPGVRADASTPSSTPTAPNPQKRVRAWFDPNLSPSETATFLSEVSCRCKGHCRVYSHRMSGKCSCSELVVGTDYCATCVCIVAGCGRPRFNTEYCFHHRRVLARAPLRVRLAVAAVPVTPLMMPCDVEDFVASSAIIQDDVAMLILAAAIKEPLAVAALVKAWKRLPAQYSGSDLRSAILCALDAADDAPHAAQLAQLHRQGVGRFFGLITTASNLGIIRPRPKSPVPRRLAEQTTVGVAQQTYRLGTNLTVYEVFDPLASNCDKFLEATRAEHHNLTSPSDAGASTPCALDDLVDYGTRRAGEALRRIGVKSGALPFSVEDASGYCIDFLRRKLVAARYINQLQECDWSVVSKASLQTMSADAQHNLHHIPEAWRAHDISCFFTGRADWALFASMFPCLWGEVADRLSTKAKAAQALELVKSNKFLQVLQQFRRNHGIAPHPAVAYQLMVADQKQHTETNQTPQRKSSKRKSKRASTPLRKRKASKTVAK